MEGHNSMFSTLLLLFLQQIVIWLFIKLVHQAHNDNLNQYYH